jgi:AcrR family transcriptional regulator
MVAGAAELIGARGVGATSVRELAKFTGAPLGSTYHYFPGGKDQLVEEAVGWVSGHIEKLLSRVGEQGALAVLDAFIANWREFLIASDYQASCPVLAVATADTVTRGPATAAFARWHDLLVEVLRHDGVEPKRAERLAWLIVGGIEGAVVMSRSQRSPEPMDAVAEELRGVIREAVNS